MLWNKVVSNGLVNYTGVLVLVNQKVFVSRFRKCFESADMQGGIYPDPHIYIIYIHIYGTPPKDLGSHMFIYN